MKNAEDYVQAMENSGILVSREFTFKEYATEITRFQSMVCKMIAGDLYYESMRIEEALFILESMARRKDLRSHYPSPPLPDFCMLVQPCPWDRE